MVSSFSNIGYLIFKMNQFCTGFAMTARLPKVPTKMLLHLKAIELIIYSYKGEMWREHLFLDEAGDFQGTTQGRALDTDGSDHRARAIKVTRDLSSLKAYVFAKGFFIENVITVLLFPPRCSNYQIPQHKNNRQAFPTSS